MFSSRRIDELEIKIECLKREIDYLEKRVEDLSHLFVYIENPFGQLFDHNVPLKDILAQLLYLHGLKIVYEPATGERFTLAKREDAADKEAGDG